MAKRTKLVEVGIMVLFLPFAASVSWSFSHPARPPVARPQREMARAAAEVLQLMQEQEDIGGRALTAEFVESKLEWSRRRVLAVRESDPAPEEELAAIRTHLAFATRTQDMLERRWDCFGNASL